MRLDPLIAAGLYAEQLPQRTGNVLTVVRLGMQAMLAAYHRDLMQAAPEWGWPDVNEGFNGE